MPQGENVTDTPTYPKGDLRRMLMVLAAMDSIPDATQAKMAARTGLDKRTVIHLISQASEQAGVVVKKEGPVYTLEGWGPILNPAGAYMTLGCSMKHSRKNLQDRTALIHTVPPGHLIQDLGHGWVSCSDALPWNDTRNDYQYVVYSPSYGGELFTCTFNSTGARWWCDRAELGISGVTHWRLARADEPESAFLQESPPKATEIHPHDVILLKRWGDWYCKHYDIEPE